jgi:hypothetical protein
MFKRRENLENVSNLISMSKNLVFLNLSQCHLYSDDLLPIMKLLSLNKTVKRLNLRDNDINDTGVKYISDFLLQNKTITDLDLSLNEISEIGLGLIANWLLDNNTITSLDIYSNTIYTNYNIILSLLQTKSLTYLGLGRVYISNGNGGFNSIIESLKTNTTLKYIDLNCNSIVKNSNRFSILIEELIKTNKSLTRIDLCQNGIDEKDGRIILNALKENTTLKTLGLIGNGITLETMNEIEMMLNYRN